MDKKLTALITGASSGIGYELSKIFARENYNLTLVDINLDKLHEVSEELKRDFHVEVTVIQLDLSEITAADNLYNQVINKSIQINVLVNNAGFGMYGNFVDSDPDTETKMMQLNMITLTRLTKLFVKDMVKRGEGRILNIASTAAFQPGPLMAVYFATKSYVLSFSEAVFRELKGTGVVVTTLCPGPTKTKFALTAGADKSNLFSNARVLDAKMVAELGYHGLMKGKRLIIAGLINKFLVQLLRITPRSITLEILKYLQRQKETN